MQHQQRISCIIIILLSLLVIFGWQQQHFLWQPSVTLNSISNILMCTKPFSLEAQVCAVLKSTCLSSWFSLLLFPMAMMWTYNKHSIIDFSGEIFFTRRKNWENAMKRSQSKFFRAFSDHFNRAGIYSLTFLISSLMHFPFSIFNDYFQYNLLLYWYIR